ncbi:hypothetical protein CH63R_04053 [Colletotrichum higginsianum IMI 349063]|nr:hypothetical protein CH63R_04053 [Colletotrichum higginsianum IMI 349063]OBR11757.1 hypothetical protein CH63R_04053 [Colletotrichum higginsianum IMI 349063]
MIALAHEKLLSPVFQGSGHLRLTTAQTLEQFDYVIGLASDNLELLREPDAVSHGEQGAVVPFETNWTTADEHESDVVRKVKRSSRRCRARPLLVSSVSILVYWIGKMSVSPVRASDSEPSKRLVSPDMLADVGFRIDQYTIRLAT